MGFLFMNVLSFVKEVFLWFINFSFRKILLNMYNVFIEVINYFYNF